MKKEETIRRYGVEVYNKQLEQGKQWRKDNPEYDKEQYQKRKEYFREHNAKKGGRGYNCLNVWEEGLVTHHFTNLDIIFIPEEIHKKYNGREYTLKRHREEIMEWIHINELELYVKCQEVLNQ